MAAIEGHISGTNTVLANLLKDIKKSLPEAAGAMNELTEETMTVAKKLVPHDFGTLENSGVVLPPVIVQGGIEQKLGFGGSAKDYAEVQHENLSFQHQDGRTAKYLEKPVAASKKNYVAKLAAKMKARRASRVS